MISWESRSSESPLSLSLSVSLSTFQPEGSPQVFPVDLLLPIERRSKPESAPQVVSGCRE